MDDLNVKLLLATPEPGRLQGELAPPPIQHQGIARGCDALGIGPSYPFGDRP